MRNLPGTGIPILYIAAFGGLAVVLAVLLLVSLRSGQEQADNDGEASSRPGQYGWITADSLVFPNELRSGTDPSWVPSRPAREAWSNEDVEEYWYDPQTIGIEVLSEKVERQISEMLEDVP